MASPDPALPLAARALRGMLPFPVLIAALAAVQVGLPHSVAGQATAPAAEDVGLSTEALAEIGPAMQEIIDGGRTGGIMTLVAHRGEIVHWDAQGWRVVGEDPLEANDIFRIYSMTKPVTSVAAMMLVDEGAMSLDQPVSDFIPAFADAQVWDEGRLRDPTRPILILDLLRHTSGLTYGVFGDTPVDRMYREQVSALDMRSGGDLEEIVDIIASLPLLFDPGAAWNYSMSTDVLGRVVEVASGLSLDAFFAERIFEPLGMEDTGFHVPAEKLDRFAAVYERTDGALQMASPPDDDFSSPPSWYSGGGGLTSTATDYLRFSQMLLNGGELEGVRLLDPQTVVAMRSNHLAEELMPIRVGGPVPDHGFGLGFAVAAGGPLAETYWWAGVANTWFWIDPVEELIAFAWTQSNPFGIPQIDTVMRRVVYGALKDPVRQVKRQ